MLAVLLEEVGEHVPPLAERAAVLLGDRVHSETLHPGHVGRAVEVVLAGALAVEADGEEVALELLHHGLEVVVRERFLLLQ